VAIGIASIMNIVGPFLLDSCRQVMPEHHPTEVFRRNVMRRS
jgi:hypothetical protein